jgi:hypothetical protein
MKQHANAALTIAKRKQVKLLLKTNNFQLLNLPAAFLFIVIRSENGFTGIRLLINLLRKGKSESSRRTMNMLSLNIVEQIRNTERFALL